MNVNFLGEALLGEAEAERRLQQYLQALQRPEIEVVSVKISTLYSQISPLAREHTVERAVRPAGAAVPHRGPRAASRGPMAASVPKFVYLDMEEYRDKDLTAEAFMRTLDRPRPGARQRRHRAAELTFPTRSARCSSDSGLGAATRRRRRRAHHHPAREGREHGEERVEASLRGWPQAPYKTKLETDANYKRMLHEGMQPENLAAVRLGVASHNLFDLAYGLVLAHEARRAATGCSSKCSKAWPTTSAARCSS